MSSNTDVERTVRFFMVLLFGLFLLPIFSGCASSGNPYSIPADLVEKKNVEDKHKNRPEHKIQFGFGSGISDAEFSPDGSRIVSGGLSPELAVWDVSSGERLIAFVHTQDKSTDLATDDMGVNTVDFSPEGNKVVSGGSDGRVVLWQVDPGKLLSSLSYSSSLSIHDVEFAPDGRNVLFGDLSDTDNYGAKLWNINTGDIKKFLHPSPVSVQGVAFGPDGKRLVTGGGGGAVILWKRETAEKIHTFQTEEGDLRTVAYSPDGNYVLSGSDHSRAVLWDVQNRKKHQVLEHDDSVRDAAFSPDGTRVLTGSWDGTAKLWAVESGKLLRVFRHPGKVSTVDFAPDGNRLLTYSSTFAGGEFCIWALNGHTDSGSKKPSK